MRNVLRVDLYDTSTEEDIHINQKLIDFGFAVFQEESHASKVFKGAIIVIWRFFGTKLPRVKTKKYLCRTPILIEHQEEDIK